MNNQEFRTKLIELFPTYVFSEINNQGSIFGVKTNETKQWRNDAKDRCISFNSYIFVSSEMYPNTDRNFVYATIYTKGEVKPYRCRQMFQVEMNKKYFSGKTYNELFENFKAIHSTELHESLK